MRNKPESLSKVSSARSFGPTLGPGLGATFETTLNSTTHLLGLTLLGLTLLVLTAIPATVVGTRALVRAYPNLQFQFRSNLRGEAWHAMNCDPISGFCFETDVVSSDVLHVSQELETLGISPRDLDTQTFAATLLEAEALYKIPHALLIGLASVESSFNPRAASAKNAQGLFQILPTTAEFLWPEFKKTLSEDDPVSRLDPRKDLGDVRLSTLLGAYYLAYLERLFQGRTHLALASYNAGPAAVQKALDAGKFISSDYVFKVFAIAQDFRGLTPRH